MGKRPSVLIIEPNHSTRTFMEMTLSHEGLRVFSAVSLDSALLQLRVLRPDLIIVRLDEQEIEEDVAAAQIRALSSAPLLVLERQNGGAAATGAGDVLPYSYCGGELCDKVAGLLASSGQAVPGLKRSIR